MNKNSLISARRPQINTAWGSMWLSSWHRVCSPRDVGPQLLTIWLMKWELQKLRLQGVGTSASALFTLWSEYLVASKDCPSSFPALSTSSLDHSEKYKLISGANVMQPELLMKIWTGKHGADAKGNFQRNELSLFRLSNIQQGRGKGWLVAGNITSKIRPWIRS